MKYRLKKNHGSHSMRVNGTMTRLVSGDTVTCEAKDIGEGSMFKFEPINESGAVVAPPPPAEDTEQPTFTLEKKHQSNGNWIVYRSDTNEPVHDGTMRKVAAEKFITDYNMPTEDEPEDEEGTDLNPDGEPDDDPVE